MNKKKFFPGIVILLVLAVCSCKKAAVQENQSSQPEESTNIEESINNESNSSYWVMENIKVREEPNTGGKQITILQRGAMVQKLDTGEKAVINNITSNWLYIQTEYGDKGWCFGGYLADSKEKAVITGYWINEKEKTVHYLDYNGEYMTGKFESSGVGGTWSYTGGNIINITIQYEHYDDDVNYSTELSFAIIDNDTVKFGDKVYKRMTR